MNLDKPVTMKEHELKIVYEELKKANWNQILASEKLGICARSIRNKVKELRKMGVMVPRCAYKHYRLKIHPEEDLDDGSYFTRPDTRSE